MQELNHSKLLGVLAGEAGDYYIGTTAVTTKKFAAIVIGPDGATVTVCKIRGVDVMTERNYGVLPAGYIMTAGGDDYFDAITLSAGNASGLLYHEDSAVTLSSIAVSNGAAGAAMTGTITFTNTGNSGSLRILWQVKNAAGTVVQTGEKVVYFLKGTGLTVSLAAGTYYSTVATGYKMDIRIETVTDWTESTSFNITA